MLFNKRFTHAWAHDGYRDYLSPELKPLETGMVVLSRLIKKGTPGGAQAQGKPSPFGMRAHVHLCIVSDDNRLASSVVT
jgi:hypothetical protein